MFVVNVFSLKIFQPQRGDMAVYRNTFAMPVLWTLAALLYVFLQPYRTYGAIVMYNGCQNGQIHCLQGYRKVMRNF
jgi:hypothetical protein